MATLIKLLRHNATPRLVVGALVAYFVYYGAVNHTDTRNKVASEPGRLVRVATAVASQPQRQSDNSARIARLAKTDHIELLNWALENYRRQVRDYRGFLYKQERINGKLKPIEKIAISFMEEPFSLLMQWDKSSGVIDKLLYVEGQNDDKMVVHPTGLLAWIKSVKRDPRSEQARRSSRRTCDQFGFRRTMLSLLEVYRQAEDQGDLAIGYVGPTQIGGRQCIALERLLPAKDEYPCGRMVVEFDLEYLLPTSITSYDWQGNLLSRYVYTELQFNTGLTGSAFDTKANGL